MNGEGDGWRVKEGSVTLLHSNERRNDNLHTYPVIAPGSSKKLEDLETTWRPVCFGLLIQSGSSSCISSQVSARCVLSTVQPKQFSERKARGRETHDLTSLLLPSLIHFPLCLLFSFLLCIFVVGVFQKRTLIFYENIHHTHTHRVNQNDRNTNTDCCIICFSQLYVQALILLFLADSDHPVNHLGHFFCK